MKSIFMTTIIAVFLFPLIGFATSQKDQLTQQRKDQIKKEIKSICDSLTVRMNRIEVEGCLQYYSPDLAVASDSIRLDFQAYKNNWVKSWKSVSTVNCKIIRSDFIILTDELVISTVVWKYEECRKSGDKLIFDPFTFTLGFKKVEEQWKVFYSHASGIPVIEKAYKK